MRPPVDERRLREFLTRLGERAHERDVTDVRAMLAGGLIERSRLRELFHAIRPRLVRFPAVEPDALARRLEEVLGD